MSSIPLQTNQSKTQANTQADIPEATTLGGRYRLVRRIGAGGMATVWEAEDRVLRRRVAVKILAQPLCAVDTIAARFRREAQAAGRLAHPNIAQVFDYGEDDACPYIVLELVPGSTLRRIIEERGRLPAGEVSAIGRQVAAALAAAHSEGVVHRDVKPGNVMVAPEGRVKVMDFGIADAVWFEPITDTGTILATARYISPERATGGGATAASDVYSLGVVLFELLAGRPPFTADSPFAVAHAHAYEAPPPIDELAPDAPETIRASVRAAMRKDARRRPRAADLAAALRDPASPEAVAMVSETEEDPASTAPMPEAAAATSTTAPTRADSTSKLPPTGGAPAHADAPTPGRSAAVWVLVGMAVLALVLTIALSAFAGAPSADRSPGAAHPSVAVSSPTKDGASGEEATNGDGPQGKAVGHDNHGGGGPGDQGHGNDD